MISVFSITINIIWSQLQLQFSIPTKLNLYVSLLELFLLFSFVLLSLSSLSIAYVFLIEAFTLSNHLH